MIFLALYLRKPRRIASANNGEGYGIREVSVSPALSRTVLVRNEGSARFLG